MEATKGSPITGLIFMFGMLCTAVILMLFLIALASTGQSVATSQQSITSTWLGNDRVVIDTNLPINDHAKKHIGEALDAWKIYALLLQGKCAAETVYCRNGSEKMYLCLDPETKLVGAIFQIDGEIRSGFGSRIDYWRRTIDKGGWERCR